MAKHVSESHTRIVCQVQFVVHTLSFPPEIPKKQIDGSMIDPFEIVVRNNNKIVPHQNT